MPSLSSIRVGCSAVVAVLSIASFLWGGAARADMVLTSAGLAKGFKLTTFASGFPTIESGTPGRAYGPFGIGFPSTGAVLVSDIFGDMRRFPTDTDGQSAGSVPIVQNYGLFNAADIAASAGRLYMDLPDRVIQINPDGTFNQFIVPLTANGGMVANPLTGHLFVSVEDPAHQQVLDVDPLAKTAVPFVDTALSPDGAAFRADGSIFYVSALIEFSPGHVLGFNTSTRALVFDSGIIRDGPDGIALGTGVLAGKMYVNTNGGRLVEIDLTTLMQTEIATGGSRGDFVKVDPNNDSLLLIQSDSILRLTAPAGGGFDLGTPVPEPGSMALFALGVAALLGVRCLRSPEIYRR